MTPRLTRSTLFPYTTLFRSLENSKGCCCATPGGKKSREVAASRNCNRRIETMKAPGWRDASLRNEIRGSGGSLPQGRPLRSEEHTSELQSLRHLVCRLLLEK